LILETSDDGVIDNENGANKTLEDFSKSDNSDVKEQNKKASKSPAPVADPPAYLKRTSEPPKLETIEDVVSAGNKLVDLLKSVAPEDRATAFVEAHGPFIVDTLRQQGQGVIVSKIKDLGVSLPDAQAAA
jgi:hypothetical protein